MTTQMERRAADARRAAAEQAAEHSGNDEMAFARARTRVQGVSAKRYAGLPPEVAQLRAQRAASPSGKQMFHTTGYFTVYERGYRMWDDFGAYDEMTMRGSGRATLAARPEVCFLVNHKGVAMARTKTGSLVLSEDSTGGFHEAWLNPDRSDVNDLVLAINDGNVDEMSFAFMIPDGMGVWSDDFTTFQIRAYDLDRGDVSAVNYGASPHTDIAGQAEEVLRSLEHLPAGAKREAAARLGVRELEQQLEARERIVVGPARAVDRGASQHVRNLQWRTANTARRYAELAAASGLSVGDLVNVRLPWFEVVDNSDILEVRDQQTGELIEMSDLPADETDILIYDEIGGSFGTTADDFARALAGIETPRINLRINSPGGSVFDAIAIASSIRHKSDDGAHIVAYVDGMAASAASVIAIAADEVVSMPGAQFMVHKASTTVDGNDDVTEKMTTFLRKQSRNIADQYAAKAGGTAAEWYALMEAETWFTPDEARDIGLVDRIWNSATKQRGERACDDPRVQRRWSELPYRYNGRADAPVTQCRRVSSDLERVHRSMELVEGNPAVDAGAFRRMVDGYMEKVDSFVLGDHSDKAETSGSTAVKAQGRSIARIQAELAAMGVTDLD